jgi:hypothetical protein
MAWRLRPSLQVAATRATTVVGRVTVDDASGGDSVRHRRAHSLPVSSSSWAASICVTWISMWGWLWVTLWGWLLEHASIELAGLVPTPRFDTEFVAS